MSEEDIFTFFAKSANIPFIKLSDYNLNDDLIKLFQESLYRERLFIPVFKIENILYVAMANPLDSDLLNMLAMQVDFEIYPLFAAPTSILAAVDKFFGPANEKFSIENLISAPRSLSMLPPSRESERVSVNMPLEIKPIDDRISLVFSSYLSATAKDVSISGKALGVRAMVFLPVGVKVLVKLSQNDLSCEVESQVVRCAIEKDGKYLLGLKFTKVDAAVLEKILANGR